MFNLYPIGGYLKVYPQRGDYIFNMSHIYTHGNNLNNSMLTSNTKHAIVLYLFNLHFYTFLSASFVTRDLMPINPTIKTTELHYVCILINVTQMLELKTHNHKQHPSLNKEPAQ